LDNGGWIAESWKGGYVHNVGLPSLGRSKMASYSGGMGEPDYAESALRSADRTVRRTTGSSALHWATLAAIGASIGLFLAGKKYAALFVGLWPPTFQALKSNWPSTER
jgi:hypothetical protein